jgi:hypothetical protein
MQPRHFFMQALLSRQLNVSSTILQPCRLSYIAKRRAFIITWLCAHNKPCKLRALAQQAFSAS